LKKSRTIAVVTGTRAEYSYLKSIMALIDKDETLELIPIVTGMHLLEEYGKSIEIIKKDFASAISIPMKLAGDTRSDMAYYLSDGIRNFTEYLSENRPEIIVVLGDRSEALAAALAALYLNIPIAHINGGDVTGKMIDESIRHAITKISHIHFAFTEANARRIEKMGEDKSRIFVTGSSSLDIILNTKLIEKKDLFSKYGLDYRKKTYLVIQHPITTLQDYGLSQLETLLDVLTELKEQIVLIFPNCDAGSRDFITRIKEFSKNDYVLSFENLSPVEYFSFMKAVDLMIGNSSSGILEAPSMKIPVINIGERQSGRERSKNIIDVPPVREAILQAIDRALYDSEFLENVRKSQNKFGEGNAAQKIVEVLKNIEITEDFIQKQITY